jgi:hypothetical protein
VDDTGLKIAESSRAHDYLWANILGTDEQKDEYIEVWTEINMPVVERSIVELLWPPC